MKYKISVIVTCCNLEDYLVECIESIKAQLTYPHEIIIIHDGCKKLVNYTNTTTIILDKNVGVAQARMLGVKIATGDYIIFIDADDKIPELFLTEMKNKIKTGKEVIYPDCVLWASWNSSGLKNAFTRMPEKITWEILSKQNWVLVSSLIPRNIFLKHRGFREYPIFEDWEFFQRLFLHKVQFVKANTWLSYRQRTNSRNRQTKDIRQSITEEIKEDIKEYIKKHIKR